MREHPLVLLIDDEEVFLDIASTKLRGEGFECVFARDVEEAIQKAESLQPDLVLSDIYMPPGQNGWHLAMALQENPKTRALKFAFFTSLKDPWSELGSDRDRVLAKLGRIAIFSKTDDINSLASRVSQLLKS